jgi:hypothetical protein
MEEQMINYLLAISGGCIVGFIVAGLLGSGVREDLERENIHLTYELKRYKKLLMTEEEQLTDKDLEIRSLKEIS